jgi:hypothetical protein
MSKRPKERPILPPKPPPTEEPPTGDPPPPNPPLIIELIHVDPHVLRESNEGEPVTVRWEDNPLIVTTLAGIHLGDVKAEDIARVRQRKSSEGTIAKMNVETVTCFVEIL